jgi:hypothetical protein
MTPSVCAALMPVQGLLQVPGERGCVGCVCPHAAEGAGGSHGGLVVAEAHAQGAWQP